ncbi:MAG: hypothetical protein RL154_1461 [Pseudomonadota bacterium]
MKYLFLLFVLFSCNGFNKHNELVKTEKIYFNLADSINPH